MSCDDRCRLALWLALAVSFALAVPAAANDSSSELAAGGLVLVKTDSISLQREDLALSPSEVRVRYEMRNDTGRPVSLRVAFPMPEVPSDSPGGLTSGAGGHNIAMRPPTDPDFLGFRVWADGKEVKPELEIRAMLPDGRDIAAALRDIGGLPLVLQPGVFFPPDDKTLDTAARQKLSDLKAYEDLDGTGYRLPWTTQITFHWMQAFAPGVTVVEHSYRPIVGARFITFEEDGTIAGSGGEDPVRAFCIDDPTRRAMRAAHERTQAKRKKAGSDDLNLVGYTLGYILQTARNWRGPIGTFHLTLQGGRVATEAWGGGAVSVMSLCTDLPLRRTAPLRFEAAVRDYVPNADLRVLFLTE